MGSGNVNHIDLLVFKEGSVIAVGASGAEVTGERIGPFRVARGDGSKLVARAIMESPGQLSRDPSGSQNPPTNTVIHRFLFWRIVSDMPWNGTMVATRFLDHPLGASHSVRIMRGRFLFMQYHRARAITSISALFGVTLSFGAIAPQLGWKHILPFGNSSVYGLAAAQDNQQALYVANRAPGVSGGGDVTVVVKQDAVGRTVWTRTFSLPSNGTPQKLAVDNLGRVYLANQKAISGGVNELDVYAMNAATGTVLFGRGYRNTGSIDAKGMFFNPTSGQLEVDLAVGTPKGAYLRTLNFTTAGLVVGDFTRSDMNPAAVVYANDGTRLVTGSSNPDPVGTALYHEISANGATIVFQRKILGQTLFGSQYKFSFAACRDEALGRLVLGVQRWRKSGASIPTVQSWVQVFNGSSHTLLYTSPITNTAVFRVSADAGLLMAAAGTDAFYSHIVLNRVGGTPWGIAADSMRDFRCYQGKLLYSSADVAGNGCLLSTYDSAGGSGAPTIPFPNATGGPFLGGDLLVQVGSYAIIGSMSNNTGVYSPSMMTVREGINLRTVSMPKNILSGAKFNVFVGCNAVAPTGGILVNLSGSGITLPATVLIPAGKSAVYVPVTAPVVSTKTVVSVTAWTRNLVRADSAYVSVP